MREAHGVIVIEPSESPSYDAIVEAIGRTCARMRPLDLMPLEPFKFSPDDLVVKFGGVTIKGFTEGLHLKDFNGEFDPYERRERNRRKRRHRKQRAK